MQFAAWWVGFIPLAVLGGLRAYGRRPSRAVVFVCLGLSVSWVADTIAWAIGGNTWWLSYLYPAPQLILVSLALIERVSWRYLFALGVVCLAVLSFIQGPHYSPEIVLYCGGALVLCWIVLETFDGSWLHRGILAYFGVGALAKVSFPLLVASPEAFLFPWGAYQLARIVGVGMIGYHAIATARPVLKLHHSRKAA